MSDAASLSSAILIEDMPQVEAEIKAEEKMEDTVAVAEKKGDEGEKLGGPEEDLPERMMVIKLQSNDGEVVHVNQDVAYKSNLIKNMMQDLQITSPDDERLNDPLPVSNIDGKTLKKILVYCEEKKNEEYKAKDEKEDPRIQLTQWDNEYMDVSVGEILALLTGANYLDIPGITDIASQKIANLADEMSIEELRQFFELVNDFSQEEEDEMKVRFDWVEEH